MPLGVYFGFGVNEVDDVAELVNTVCCENQTSAGARGNLQELRKEGW